MDLVPLDATRQTTINRDQLHAALARRPGPLAACIAACTEQTFRLWGYMHLHDPLAVGLAVDARAVVSAVIASIVGEPMVYVSGGSEHQGPPGGGPVAVIARA